MPPAARLADAQVCQMIIGVIPHVGGPILPPGCTTVIIIIGGMQAATGNFLLRLPSVGAQQGLDCNGFGLLTSVNFQFD